MLNIQKMSNEHETLFPLADLVGQIMKAEEECNEVRAAEDEGDFEHELEERADVIICCIGIYRFAPEVARTLARGISKGYDWNILEKKVMEKWQVNLNRTWEYKQGRYHHI